MLSYFQCIYGSGSYKSCDLFTSVWKPLKAAETNVQMTESYQKRDEPQTSREVWGGRVNVAVHSPFLTLVDPSAQYDPTAHFSTFCHIHITFWDILVYFGMLRAQFRIFWVHFYIFWQHFEYIVAIMVIFGNFGPKWTVLCSNFPFCGPKCSQSAQKTLKINLKGRCFLKVWLNLPKWC